MAAPHLHVILGNAQLPPALHAVLEREDYTTSFWQLSHVVQQGAPTRTADATIVVVRPDLAQTNHQLEILFDRLADEPRPVVVVSVGGGFARLPAAPARLPVSFIERVSEEDFAARLRTIVEMRDSFSALATAIKAERSEANEVMRRYQQQLRLASRVQKELASKSISRVGPVSFRTVNRSVDYVSGDIFEVNQLNDNQVGIFLADATGHGLPAAMLTTFLRRALQRATLADEAICPSEVLTRLNSDLVDADLSECPFVAAFCGVLDLRNLVLTWARAGAPHPFVRRADGSIEQSNAPGRVLGVTANAACTVQQTMLQPGDSFLVHSDGLDPVVEGIATMPQVAEAFSRAAVAAVAANDTNAPTTGLLERPTTTTSSHHEPAPAFPTIVGTLGVDEALSMATIRFDTLRRMHKQLDDLTIVSVQIDPE